MSFLPQSAAVHLALRDKVRPLVSDALASDGIAEREHVEDIYDGLIQREPALLEEISAALDLVSRGEIECLPTAIETIVSVIENYRNDEPEIALGEPIPADVVSLHFVANRDARVTEDRMAMWAGFYGYGSMTSADRRRHARAFLRTMRLEGRPWPQIEFFTAQPRFIWDAPVSVVENAPRVAATTTVKRGAPYPGFRPAFR